MSYFVNIKEAVVSIAKGMGITIRTFFQTPETVQYPDHDVLDPNMPGYKGHLKPIADGYRGILTVEPDSCVLDMLCVRTCPVDCIQIEGVKGPKIKAKNLLPNGKDLPKARYATRFDIHIGRCMYCGLCVEACNTGAIHFTREFRGQTRNYNDLIRSFVSEEDREKLTRMADEFAAKEAEEKAKKEKEAAEKKPGEGKAVEEKKEASKPEGEGGE